MENGHVTEIASLMEGEWSCYGGGQFKEGRIVMLQRWPVKRRENGHVTEEGSSMEGVVTEVARLRENGHVTEVVTLIEGEWSCYRRDHFNEGIMVILQRWPV